MIPSLWLDFNSPIAKAFLSAILLSFAQIELKVATTQLGETIKLFGSFSQFSMSSRFLHSGLFVVFSCIGVILWVTALRNTDLSNIYWTTAICYLIVPVASSYVLDDSLGLRNIIGYFIIAVGLVIANGR